MPHIAVRGVASLAFDVDGPAGAPALLFINSIAATRALWDAQAAALGDRFRIVRYDARGHGESSVVPGPCTIDDLGRDALAVLDAAGIEAVHVCGLSLGGLTAQWLGVHAPARVRSLVLANTAARIGTVESWTARIALVREKGMAAVADLVLPNWFTPEFRARHPEVVNRFRQAIESTPVEGYLACCAALRDADLRDQVAAIGCPTLAIAGARDTATPPEALAFICDRVPGARMVTFDAGHLTNVECAEAFTREIVEFLQAAARAE
jgi:3-oxoadipate enol-lactonase